MTPAVKALDKSGIDYRIHRYESVSESESESERGWGKEAAAALGIDPRQVFKTLIIEATGGSGSHAVAVLPVDRMLDLRAAAHALRAKRVKLADPADAERVTGYVTGGISPFGQRKRLPMLLDDSALNFPAVHVSGGRRGLEIEIVPADFTAVTGAMLAAITR